MRQVLFAVLLLAPITAATSPAPAQAAEVAPDPATLLGQIDANLAYTTRTALVRMTVASPQRTRTFEMRTFGRGESEAAIEYLAPARDKGTRMLRKGDELWTWMPSVERTQKISGHMLRQGIMGSDLSYEDLMGATRWKDAYTATVTGSETQSGADCWRVELVARDPGVAYPKRVAWVTKDTRIPIRQELYAASGMLLKTWTMTDVKEFGGGRRFPMRMEIRDQLLAGSATTIEMLELTFGVDVADETFSLRWLERR